MTRLAGKTALITGASGGIGGAAAALFARNGARVALTDIVADAGERVAREIRDGGGEAIFLAADITSPAAVEATVAGTLDAFGRLDVLYNNAGGATPRDGKVTEVPLDEFWRAIGVDLFGTFLMCRFAIPHLAAAGGGAIINTTSIRALTGTQGADAYTCAKGAVLTLTKALAQECAPQNIRVNAISPGVVATERVKRLLREDDPIVGKSLLGVADPIDVAYLALYLASDESRRVTGAILPIDSGASAH
jgi:NAD(P)-dependent dehydrogenase (short-subunit alcohol dehydrogenase family)